MTSTFDREQPPKRRKVNGFSSPLPSTPEEDLEETAQELSQDPGSLDTLGIEDSDDLVEQLLRQAEENLSTRISSEKEKGRIT
jgi:hypothetical protein